MKKYTLKEAWAFVDEKYPYVNVYDAYVLKQDYMAALDAVSKKTEISKELITIESSFGITRLQEIVILLHEKLEAITLPPIGYKWNIPEEIERDVKEEHRKTKKKISEIEEEIEALYNTVYVEADVVHGKKWT